MTAFSRHQVTARVLDVAGDIPLAGDLAGGVSLDASRLQHVQGQITVADRPGLLEQIDPRSSRRVSIDVSATFLSSGAARARSFDLGIREVTPNRSAGTVTLQLASDEALLEDFAQLEDDPTPRQHQASVRALTNYVLSKIGATLQPGGPDADVTAYWPLQNQLANPSVEGALTPWTAGGNCSLFFSSPTQPGNPAGIAAAGYQSIAAGQLAVVPNALGSGPSVSPGKTYTLSAYGRRFITPNRTMFAVIRWLDASGIPVAPDVEGTPVALSDGSWIARCHVTATAPARATRAEVFFRVNGSTAAGQIGYIDCAMFNEGELQPYFDGSLPDDAHYAFNWAGEANKSASSREPLHDAPVPEAFVWRAGTSAMDFLSTLLKAAGLRLVCDERRRWTLREAGYRAEGNQTYRHGVNIETSDERLSREGDDWYDAAVYVYIWTDDAGIEQRRVDSFSAVPSPTKVRYVEVRTPYPGPGRAEHIVRRALSRGRILTVTTVPTWLEQTDQTLSIVLEGAPIQTGIAGTIAYNFDDDTMSVTSRTADTPAAAWVLIPAGETWNDSPSGASWIEEVI